MTVSWLFDRQKTTLGRRNFLHVDIRLADTHSQDGRFGTMTLPAIRQHMQSHNREDASGC
jgi:hypothetical protein